MIKKLIPLMCLTLIAFTSHANEYLYILSAKAKLFAAPSFNSITLDRVSKGQRVISLEKNNHWFKVKYKEKIGWLSSLAVSPHPSMKRVSLLAKNEASLHNEARSQASAVSTTAAIAELQNESHNRVSDREENAFTTLATIDTFLVPPEKVEQFIKVRPNQ